jgi:hypothetical protein
MRIVMGETLIVDENCSNIFVLLVVRSDSNFRNAVW